MRPNPLISLFFSLTLTLILLIVANTATDQRDFDSTELIAAFVVSTCDRGIFPFRKSITMTSFSWTIFSHFYRRQLFPLLSSGTKESVGWFRYTTQARTFM